MFNYILLNECIQSCDLVCVCTYKIVKIFIEAASFACIVRSKATSPFKNLNHLETQEYTYHV